MGTDSAFPNTSSATTTTTAAMAPMSPRSAVGAEGGGGQFGGWEGVSFGGGGGVSRGSTAGEHPLCARALRAAWGAQRCLWSPLCLLVRGGAVGGLVAVPMLSVSCRVPDLRPPRVPLCQRPLPQQQSVGVRWGV